MQSFDAQVCFYETNKNTSFIGTKYFEESSRLCKIVRFNKIVGWDMCKLSKHDRQYLHRKWINLVRPKSLIKTNNTLFHEHILTTYILYIHTVEWDLLLVWQSVCVVDKDVNSLMYVIRLNRNQAYELKEICFLDLLD